MDQFFAGLDMEKMMQAMMPMLQSIQDLQTATPKMVVKSMVTGKDMKEEPEVTNFLECLDQTVANPDLKKMTEDFTEAAQCSGLMDGVAEMSTAFGKFGETLKVSVVDNILDPVTSYCKDKDVLAEELSGISEQLATATQNDEVLSFDVTKSPHAEPIMNMVAAGMEQILKGPLFQDPQMLTTLLGAVLKSMPIPQGGMAQIIKERDACETKEEEIEETD